MAGSSLFLNLARAAKVVALLLFLLPWVTVSCSSEAIDRTQSEAAGSAPRLNMPTSLNAGVPVADASGLNMATGQLRMLLPNTGPREQAKASEPPAVPIEIGVIAGAALILLALLASFLLKGATGAMAAIGGSVLAIGALCYSVFVSYPPAVRAALAAHNPSGPRGESAPTPDQIAQILSVKPEIAFYLVLVALALAVLFNALALRKPGAAAPAPPAGA
ncbi:MAG TPA: hypothetical protein VEC11_17225 [Allosphingosinicella sp.]|nr:hypothetical protein [Allosphingosinicella sp.]